MKQSHTPTLPQWATRKNPMQMSLDERNALNDYLTLRERNDKLVATLREIKAINDESTSAFRKRGGTRRGLTLIEIAKVLDECPYCSEQAHVGKDCNSAVLAEVESNEE
jgi:hypothetical protein